MYATQAAAFAAFDAGVEEEPLGEEEEIVPGARSSNGGGDKALRDKQERLRRAARLLKDGAEHS